MALGGKDYESGSSTTFGDNTLTAAEDPHESSSANQNSVSNATNNNDGHHHLDCSMSYPLSRTRCVIVFSKVITHRLYLLICF